MMKYYVAAQAWLAAKSCKGQGLAEYGLILALIAVFCIGALVTLGEAIDHTLRDIAENLGG